MVWFLKKDKGVDKAKKHHEELQKKVQKAKTLRDEIQEIERRMQRCEERRRKTSGHQAEKYVKLFHHLGKLKKHREHKLEKLSH